MIKSKKSIIINKPVRKVWDFFILPNIAREWLDSDQLRLVSSWQLGEQVAVRLITGEDYSRGDIIKLEKYKYISFTQHDAYEEDSYDPEYDGEEPNWNESTWNFIFKDLSDKIELSLEIIDHDNEHYTYEDHDHQEAVRISKEIQDITIPTMLKNIKQQIEKNNL